jgi:adenine/guanine phosphoribosyltransferase-like PRPP-binding protein
MMKITHNESWSVIDTVACCEAGSLIYASPLALQGGLPLTLMREVGKLPPPTVSAIKRSSYISSMTIDSLTPDKSREKRIEMQRDMLSTDARVVIIDDVLSTGETLCAMLKLLTEAGIDVHNICIMVVVEFPMHRSRQVRHQQGFGKVRIQSLLVIDGA